MGMSRQKTINQLYSLQRKVSGIISELENSSWGLRNNFKGIGTNVCSDRIDDIISHYRYVYNRLDYIARKMQSEEDRDRYNMENNIL